MKVFAICRIWSTWYMNTYCVSLFSLITLVKRMMNEHLWTKQNIDQFVFKHKITIFDWHIKCEKNFELNLIWRIDASNLNKEIIRHVVEHKVHLIFVALDTQLFVISFISNIHLYFVMNLCNRKNSAPI